MFAMFKIEINTTTSYTGRINKMSPIINVHTRAIEFLKSFSFILFYVLMKALKL